MGPGKSFVEMSTVDVHTITELNQVGGGERRGEGERELQPNVGWGWEGEEGEARG